MTKTKPPKKEAWLRAVEGILVEAIRKTTVWNPVDIEKTVERLVAAVDKRSHRRQAFTEWYRDYEKDNTGARLAELDAEDAMHIAFAAGRGTLQAGNELSWRPERKPAADSLPSLDKDLKMQLMRLINDDADVRLALEMLFRYRGEFP